MKILPFLTAALVVLFPYTLATEPNGSLRMAIARWAERKGKDLRRTVRQLDYSATKLAPNEPYIVHMGSNPLSRVETSDIISTKKFAEPGTYALDHMFTKKLSTTWNWGREYNLDYILNVSQPVYRKVPDESLVRVESMGKDFWEFTNPMSWDKAEVTCRAAGLKLAQPKTQKEVEELQKVLHTRIHNRESGCKDETWKKRNGYCLHFAGGFMFREDAATHCENMNSKLPFPALGNVTAWQEAVMDSITGSSIIYAGARQAPNGEWFWEDNSIVQLAAWMDGDPDGKGECSVINHNTGKLNDKSCSITYQTLCQGHSSSHWLGAIGSDEKCVKWVDGKCIKEEDYDPNSNMDDLWQTGQPGDLISPNYALQLQIENEKPFTLRKITERRPFLCESACPLGFVNLGTQCLLVKMVWLTWHEAQAACVKIGLQLYKTKEEKRLADFLLSQEITGTYWIGGIERNVAGQEANMTIIIKLPFICELTHGTRKMNVTNQLSYSDQEKAKLPKVVTESSNSTVTVTERTITETYPFSVQMDITGWMWVEYSRPTDEHGAYQCDNNNDWVSGEFCWAHSKWGYSTSYLHDGDQIMAQGDNARLTLNGTVTYIYNEHQVNIKQSGPDSARHSVRSKRSIASLEKSSKNYKNKANNIDDGNKPLMSQLGKRAEEWVRDLAQEKKAHLVAYTIDQLSPTVTDLVVENEVSGLSTPSSIFEEEFENTGSEPVFTTFKRTKSIVNSYRWSVSKGLSIEDSHISSYTRSNTQSETNTFSLSNNIEQTEGTSQSSSQGTTGSSSSSEGGSESDADDSSNTETISDSQSSSNSGSNSVGTSQSNSVGSKDSSIVSSSVGSTTGEGQTTGESETINSGSSGTISTSNAQSDTNTITDADSKISTQISSDKVSQSESNSQTSTITDQESNSSSNQDGNTKSKGTKHTTGWGIDLSAKGTVYVKGVQIDMAVGFQFGQDKTNTNNRETESTRSRESSSTVSHESTNSHKTSVNNEKTSTDKQSIASETEQSSQQSNTLDQTNTNVNSDELEKTNTSDASTSHETITNNENKSTQDNTANSEEGQKFDNSQTYDDTHAADKKSSVERNKNEEYSVNYERTHERDNRYDRENNINQERKKGYESSRGGDVTQESQYSQNTKKIRTHQVNLDRNEEVESSEEESLETSCKITIPAKTLVKIEWRVEHRKIRLPWKASIHMTGWINVRFKNDDAVCDIYHGSRWTYNYTSPCKEDNRLYGYPLSYLKDENFIQQGEGLRFVASGDFEAVMVTSHFLRVTETSLEEEPRHSERRKRDLTKLRSKVTDYPLEFDAHGNGKAHIGKKFDYFKRFHAKRKLRKISSNI